MNLGYFNEIAALLNVMFELVAAWKYPLDISTLPIHITAKCNSARKRGSHSRLCLNARDSESESGLGSETLQSEEKGILRW